MLFDVENPSFVHLDGSASYDHDEGHGNGRAQNQFIGLIYQPSTIKGGGVEINSQLGQRGNPALVGQVFAYSYTSFGQSNGVAVDFSQGYGATNSPIVSSGQQEASLISSVTLVQAKDSSGNPISGMETLVVTYTDEWALDAYATYVKVNNGNPVFFSQGVWNPAPAANQPQPPAANTPGDAHPARPNTASPSPYTAASDPVTNLNTDWSLSIPNGTPTNSTFETSGNWTWGHERDIPNATIGPNTATIKFTFPTPAGTTVTITMFITDGDRCGDYALSTATMNNVGQPYSGGQGVGSVRLVQ